MTKAIEIRKINFKERYILLLILIFRDWYLTPFKTKHQTIRFLVEQICNELNSNIIRNTVLISYIYVLYSCIYNIYGTKRIHFTKFFSTSYPNKENHNIRAEYLYQIMPNVMQDYLWYVFFQRTQHRIL